MTDEEVLEALKINPNLIAPETPVLGPLTRQLFEELGLDLDNCPPVRQEALKKTLATLILYGRTGGGYNED